MSRFDGMVALGITILVDDEVNFLFILSCDILLNYHYERHRLNPSKAPNYPMGIHIGSKAVADDWSMILMGYCGLVVGQLGTGMRIQRSYCRLIYHSLYRWNYWPKSLIKS
jgi:hypothetical protein